MHFRVRVCIEDGVSVLFVGLYAHEPVYIREQNTAARAHFRFVAVCRKNGGAHRSLIFLFASRATVLRAAGVPRVHRRKISIDPRRILAGDLDRTRETRVSEREELSLQKTVATLRGRRPVEIIVDYFRKTVEILSRRWVLIRVVSTLWKSTIRLYASRGWILSRKLREALRSKRSFNYCISLRSFLRFCFFFFFFFFFFCSYFQTFRWNLIAVDTHGDARTPERKITRGGNIFDRKIIVKNIFSPWMFDGI